MKNEPNKAMQPTPVAVTSRADARAAPSTSVADLGRSAAPHHTHYAHHSVSLNSRSSSVDRSLRAHSAPSHGTPCMRVVGAASRRRADISLFGVSLRLEWEAQGDECQDCGDDEGRLDFSASERGQPASHDSVVGRWSHAALHLDSVR